MSCAGCAAGISKMLQGLPGVRLASINFATKRLEIHFDDKKTGLQALQKAVQDLGYELILHDDEDQALAQQEAATHRQVLHLRRKVVGAWALALPLILLSMVFMHLPYAQWVSGLLSLLILVLFGRDFFIHAWQQAKHRRANMDSLVALSTGVAFIFSAFTSIHPLFWLSRGIQPQVYYEAAGVVVAFVLLGKYLEARAQKGSFKALRQLMGLQAKTALLINAQGVETEVVLTSLQAGQHILVRPGSQIPVDGRVVAGHSYVDEQMINGEPMPVEKQAGGLVYSGTLNQQGSLRVEALSIGRDTLLSRIIQKVQQAQGSRVPVQGIVDKISGIFVPVVLGLSLLCFALWLLLGGTDYVVQALLSSVSVLVIACPCALGLATPTALVAGIGKGASLHILIKNASALEKLRQVNCVVLDKTGTLTLGQPRLLGQVWAEGSSETERRLLLGAETQSEHPLGRAICEALLAEGCTALRPTQFENLPGKGLVFSYQEQAFWVGQPLHFHASAPIPTEMQAAVESWKARGASVLFYGSSARVMAALALSDPLKPQAAAALSQLRKMGMEVHLLTGDQLPAARHIASALGITHIAAGQLPDQKEQYIKDLQAAGRRVAMVGDGINDAQAFAQAYVSIAMGKGADLAMEVADITLISSDLSLLPQAIHLSQATMRLIRQNLFWAFGYNVLMIPVAAGALYPISGLLFNPMWAGAAMAFSSLSVVLNSLRLRA